MLFETNHIYGLSPPELKIIYQREKSPPPQKKAILVHWTLTQTYVCLFTKYIKETRIYPCFCNKRRHNMLHGKQRCNEYTLWGTQNPSFSLHIKCFCSRALVPVDTLFNFLTCNYTFELSLCLFRNDFHNYDDFLGIPSLAIWNDRVTAKNVSLLLPQVALFPLKWMIYLSILNEKYYIFMQSEEYHPTIEKALPVFAWEGYAS